jgi:hypothetical protein
MLVVLAVVLSAHGAQAEMCSRMGTYKLSYDADKTLIGEGAFVGTNSSLVAPVKVGKGAYIGSGSVITRDVPDDAMAVERSPEQPRGWGGKVPRDEDAGESAERGLSAGPVNKTCLGFGGTMIQIKMGARQPPKEFAQ